MLTDKDIIKTLEYCFTNDWNRTKCDKCAFYTGTTLCVEDLKSASINLINRKKAEIERLRKEVNLVSIQFQDLQERYEEAQAEIERLKQENNILSKNADTAFQDGLNEAQDLYAEQVKSEVKSEAIKEFAERL